MQGMQIRAWILMQFSYRYVAKITALRDAIYKKAKVNIDKAQEEYKKYYDKKHRDIRVNDNKRLCFVIFCLIYIFRFLNQGVWSGSRTQLKSRRRGTK